MLAVQGSVASSRWVEADWGVSRAGSVASSLWVWADWVLAVRAHWLAHFGWNLNLGRDRDSVLHMMIYISVNLLPPFFCLISFYLFSCVSFEDNTLCLNSRFYVCVSLRGRLCFCREVLLIQTL